MQSPPHGRPGGSRAVAALILGAALGAAAPGAVGQLRVVNYNVANLNGDLGALGSVLDALVIDDRPGFAVAPHVLVFQEVGSDDLATLQSLLNAAAPSGVVYVAATYTNIGEDGSGGAQALFYRDDVLGEDAAAHADVFTFAGRYADRWRLTLDGYDAPEASFYVYGMHLKASTGARNEELREDGALAIRANAATLPAGSHVIYAGDMNFYDNGEPGYAAFLSGGAGQAIDPLGSGSWNGSGQAIKHTQSPRLNGDGLVGGGLDDRFDFQLSTAAMHDGEGLSLMSAVYRAFGNDGQHYDDAINAGNNFYYAGQVARSNALADDLHDASDHVPVIAEYQLPAAMSASMPADFGKAIQFSTASIMLSVGNAVASAVPSGGDELEYAAISSGALSGSGSGTIPALGANEEIPLAIDTTIVGLRSGAVLLTTTSQGAANDEIFLPTGGTIVRPAAPSFSSSEEITELETDWSITADSGVQTLDVPVHNFAWDALQARLDVDAVLPVAGGVTFEGGLATGLGAAPATLSIGFDTDGAAPGVVEASLLITVSDEDIPGATTSFLALAISITVEGGAGPGDVDGDGDVDFSDLVSLLSAWGSCPAPPASCPADFDGDGQVAFNDLVTLLSNWG